MKNRNYDQSMKLVKKIYYNSVGSLLFNKDYSNFRLGAITLPFRIMRYNNFNIDFELEHFYVHSVRFGSLRFTESIMISVDAVNKSAQDFNEIDENYYKAFENMIEFNYE